MDGSQETFLFHEHTREDGSIEYFIPSISIVPPHEKAGCYVNLYYNVNILEDTLYVSKEKKTESRYGNWEILHDQQGPWDHYRRDHYVVFKIIPDKKMILNPSSSPGKNWNRGLVKNYIIRLIIRLRNVRYIRTHHKYTNFIHFNFLHV